jgi:hypothetical protein
MYRPALRTAFSRRDAAQLRSGPPGGLTGQGRSSSPVAQGPWPLTPLVWARPGYLSAARCRCRWVCAQADRWRSDSALAGGLRVHFAHLCWRHLCALSVTRPAPEKGRMARSRPRSGREAAAKASAIRTLERPGRRRHQDDAADAGGPVSARAGRPVLRRRSVFARPARHGAASLGAGVAGWSGLMTYGALSRAGDRHRISSKQ